MCALFGASVQFVLTPLDEDRDGVFGIMERPTSEEGCDAFVCFMASIQLAVDCQVE